MSRNTGRQAPFPWEQQGSRDNQNKTVPPFVVVSISSTTGIPIEKIDVLVDAAIYLQDQSILSEQLDKAFQKVRDTDSSYKEKDNMDIAADIIIASEGRFSGW